MSKPKIHLPPNTPRTFAVVLYTQFEVLDVFGPLEALNTLSRNLADSVAPMTCYMFAPTKDPVRSGPKAGMGSTFTQAVVPTHAFDDPDLPDADVLIVPGGLGPPESERQRVVDFVQGYYARRIKGQAGKYLFTVCTGAGLAGSSATGKPGVSALDGVAATTNKAAWEWLVGTADEPKLPKTWWVANARWVPQGSIWTTSGVSAGTDGMVAWIASVYGEDKAQFVCNGMEYNREANPSLDPFAAVWGAEDVPSSSAEWIVLP